MRKKKVVILGDLNLDIILKIDELPPPDTSVAVENASYMPGGVGGNVASHILDQTVEPVLLSAVGKDPIGDFLLRDLKERGISTSYIKVVGKPSGVMIILLNSEGEKRILGVRGANEEAAYPEEELEAAISGASIVHGSGYFFLNSDEGASLLNSYRVAKTLGIPTSLDLEGIALQKREILREIERQVDYVFVNTAELLELTGINDVKQGSLALWRILKPKAIFIKAGNIGSYLRTGENVFIYVKGKSVKPVDPTGAGDAYNAAVLKSIIKGENPINAAKEGNKAGMKAALKIGGR